MVRLWISLLSGILLAGASTAFGQAYPTKPIRIIVGSGAGGSVDTVARALAEGLSKELNQPVVIENMPGASGILASRYIANSQPDGYTLFALSDVTLVSPIYFKNLGFDFLQGMDSVAMYARDRLILGTYYDAPFQKFEDMVAYAKANPGKLNHGTNGPGDLYIIFMAIITQKYGLDIVNIAYKAGPAKAMALLAKDIQLNFSNQFVYFPLLESKRARPLAVTGERRMSAFPDLPTFKELGMEGMNDNSHIILTAANTPVLIIEKLSRSIAQVVQTPEWASRLSKLGMETVFLGPAATKKYMAESFSHYTAVARAAGIQPQ